MCGKSVTCSNREFLEKVLKEHDRVESFNGDDVRQYTVSRKRGDEMLVYLTGKYTFGIIDFYEVRTSHPRVNCIVTASPYLSYTRDAKDAARDSNIGLFTLKEFLGALNFADFWLYEPKT